MDDADQLRRAGGIEYSLDGVSDEELAALSAALFEAGVRHAVGSTAVVVHPDDEAAADEALDDLYGPDTDADPEGDSEQGGSPPAEQRLLAAELRATGGPVYDLGDHPADEVAELSARLADHDVRHALAPGGELVVHRNDERRAEAVFDEVFGVDHADPADMTLLALVDTYAAFGDHRAGSKADLDTAAWLTDHLEALGADVAPRQVVFDRYDVRATLHGPDGEIDCVPVFYEALGSIETTDLEILHAPGHVVGAATGLDPLLNATPTAPARIVVIDGPPGWPVAANRPIAAPGRVPTVVVASDAADAVAGATIDFDAQLVPGVAPLVIAELGPSGGPPVTVTTPLSGWFTCAGERATGLAIAVDLCRTLAERGHSVRFVAPSGHELAHLGVRVWLEEVGHDAGPVVHLGASVAACEPGPDGSLHLAEGTRFVLADAVAPAALTTAVAPASFSVVDPDPWPGEGAEWRAAGAQVLSFVGRFQWFHTANDVPTVATDSRALQTACSAVHDAVDVFLDAAHG